MSSQSFMGFLFVGMSIKAQSVFNMLDRTCSVDDKHIQPVIGALPVRACLDDEIESPQQTLALLGRKSVAGFHQCRALFDFNGKQTAFIGDQEINLAAGCPDTLAQQGITLLDEIGSCQFLSPFPGLMGQTPPFLATGRRGLRS